MLTTRPLLAVIAAALLISLAPVATATPFGGMPTVGESIGADSRVIDADTGVMQKRCMSLSDAVDRVRRKYPNGRIISAETKGRSHVIKVLTEGGKVRTERFPAC